jgi:Cep192 domain 4
MNRFLGAAAPAALILAIFALGAAHDAAGGAAGATAALAPAASRETITFMGVAELSKVPQMTGAPTGHGILPFRPLNPAAYAQGKQLAESPSALAQESAAAVLQEVTAPAPIVSVNGISEPASFCDCEPPDTQVATGPNHVVEAVNLAMSVFDKQGTRLAGYPKSLNTFFSLGSNFSSDPRIRFDQLSQRWFISLLSLDNQVITNAHNGFIDLAVSQTSDPTGNWNVYQFATPGILPDQPGLGFSDDKVALSDNAFLCSPNCGAQIPFEGNELLIIDKSDVETGAANPRTDQYGPDADSHIGTIQPARSLSSTSTLYLVGVNDVPSSTTTYNLLAVTGTPPGTSIDPIGGTLTHSMSFPPAGVQPLPPQGKAEQIDTGDDRIEDALYRDGSVWASGNSACRPQGDSTNRACLRIIQLQASNGTIIQDFDFGIANTYLYYPAIEVDSAGNLYTAFSQSSSNQFPSAMFSQQLSGTDPAGTLETPVLLVGGQRSYSSGENTGRWGDYSGAGLDPDPAHPTVWVAAEYATSTASFNWGTWIAELPLQTQGAPGPTPTPTPTPTPAPGKLKLNHHSLGFGKVATGTTRTRTLKIKNAGKGVLIGTITQPQPQPLFSTVAGGTGFTLNKGEKAFFTLQFSPSAPGLQTGSVTITSNDPNHQLVTVTLHGKGK